MNPPIGSCVIEPLSPRLHELVSALSADPRALTRRVVDIVKEAIPDNTLSPDPSMQQQLWDLVVLHLRCWWTACSRRSWYARSEG